MSKKPYFIVQWRDGEGHPDRKQNWGEESTEDLRQAVERCDARRTEGLVCRVLALTEVEVY